MAMEHNNDKVLFELRVNADGSTTITTSAEWDAYHATRRGRWRREVRFGPRHETHKATKTHDLRAALNSLENIYNDLYAEPTG